MNILRKIKNIVEINPLFNKAFDLLGKCPFYRKIVYFKISQFERKIKKNKNYNIIIETTNLCNARCVMCPHSIMKREKEVMTDYVFSRVVKKLILEKISPQVFIINGFGEPLTDPKIFERIKKLKRLFPQVPVKFYSNFNLARDSTIKEIFESGLDEINISLNGYSSKSYEEVMGIKYEKTINNLKRLISEKNKRKSKLTIRLSMALVETNERGAKRFVEKWEKLVDSVSVNRVHTYGNVIKDVSDSYKINYKKMPYPCKYIWNTIVFGVRGDIFLCCLDYEGKYIFGNVLKDNILDSFYSEKFNKIRELHKQGNIKNLPICAACYTPFRNGIEWFIEKLY